LVFEAHVKHTVSLIEYKIRNSLQVGNSFFKQINESSGRCDKNIHSEIQLLLLAILGDATINDSGANPGRFTEFDALFVDLDSQLTSWGEH
jgi:hypothetical protein